MESNIGKAYASGGAITEGLQIPKWKLDPTSISMILWPLRIIWANKADPTASKLFPLGMWSILLPAYFFFLKENWKRMKVQESSCCYYDYYFFIATLFTFHGHLLWWHEWFSVTISIKVYMQFSTSFYWWIWKNVETRWVILFLFLFLSSYAMTRQSQSQPNWPKQLVSNDTYLLKRLKLRMR